jgi:hypothetical protein
MAVICYFTMYVDIQGRLNDPKKNNKISMLNGGKYDEFCYWKTEN